MSDGDGFRVPFIICTIQRKSTNQWTGRCSIIYFIGMSWMSLTMWNTSATMQLLPLLDLIRTSVIHS